jgi:hypothetical protein
VAKLGNVAASFFEHRSLVVFKLRLVPGEVIGAGLTSVRSAI